MRTYSIRLIAGFLACAALMACGSVELPSKKVEYKSAGKLPPLEVPPDLTRPGSDERFAVPDSGRGTATFSAYQKEREARGRYCQHRMTRA
jgi:outer membrane protein assembly factor BamC